MLVYFEHIVGYSNDAQSEKNRNNSPCFIIILGYHVVLKECLICSTENGFEAPAKSSVHVHVHHSEIGPVSHSADRIA